MDGMKRPWLGHAATWLGLFSDVLTALRFACNWIHSGIHSGVDDDFCFGFSGDYPLAGNRIEVGCELQLTGSAVIGTLYIAFI